MKILVTGGAGFIGSHVCEALLKEHKVVICVDNFNSFYNPKFKERNISKCVKNKRFKLYKKDIRDLKGISKILKKEKPNKIIHLAARAGVRRSIAQPLLYQDINVRGTLNLLEATRKNRIENFIFGSSSSVYGARKKGPFSEENRVDNPISPYAATKKAGEELCYYYHHLYGLNITCLRLFTVYGPRGRPDMALYKFTSLISKGKPIEMYGDGSSKRDYTYVSDIIDGILAALNKNLNFAIINLGNSKPIQLRYFISLIEKSLGKKAKIKQLPIQPGDISVTYANINKAKRLLGYKPKVKIEEGIKLFVEWYKSFYKIKQK